MSTTELQPPNPVAKRKRGDAYSPGDPHPLSPASPRPDNRARDESDAKLSEGFFSRWRRKRRMSRVERIDLDVLRHFAASVESELDLLGAANPDAVSNGNHNHMVRTIRAKLGEISATNAVEINWSFAYHAEKLLLALFSDDRVGVELPRRLDRLARTDAPFASFYRGALAEIEDPKRSSDTELTTARRNLLISLVDDVQSHNCKRYIKMRYARSAIYKVGGAFVLAFLVFISALTWLHWEPPPRGGNTGAEPPASAVEGVP